MLKVARLRSDQIRLVQARVDELLQRMQPPTGVVHGAPAGARVVRGPDWEWDDQDGDGLGTVLVSHQPILAHHSFDHVAASQDQLS